MIDDLARLADPVPRGLRLGGEITVLVGPPEQPRALELEQVK